MASFTVDLSNVRGDLSAFPNGIYACRVLSASPELSKASNSPMIVLELELYHPTFGTATMRDWLPSKMLGKIRSFWVAANNWGEEQASQILTANPEVDINADDLVGVELLVNVGEKPSLNDATRMIKEVSPPYYFPLSRQAQLLKWDN